MDRITIRQMQEGDIPVIMKIELDSFSTPWSQYSFLVEIYKKNAVSKVAVFKEKLIGYICANYLFHEAHILNLAVDPDFRRQGIATLLMNETLMELKKKECVFIYLEVRTSNTGARTFYKIFGFKVESVRKKYYVNPVEDAIIMMGRL